MLFSVVGVVVCCVWVGFVIVDVCRFAFAVWFLLCLLFGIDTSIGCFACFDFGGLSLVWFAVWMCGLLCLWIYCYWRIAWVLLFAF